MVNIRLGAVGRRPTLNFPRLSPAGAAEHSGARTAYFTSATTPLTAKVYRRDALAAGIEIAGPALIQEHGTTTVLFEHDRCRVAESGELIVAVGGAQ